MWKSRILLALVVFALVGACQAAPSPSPTEVPPGTVAPTSAESTQETLPEEPAAECPSPATDSVLLNHPAGGYCTLYPAEYGLVYPPPRPHYLADEACIVPWPPSESLLCARALAWIEVESASGRTASQVADGIIAGYSSLKIERSSLTIGGEEAVVLDGLQGGVDKQRKVLVVHEDRLYTLTFARGRGYEEGGEYYVQGETLYTTLVNSFTFLPVE